jgi:hypothetical protein
MHDPSQAYKIYLNISQGWYVAKYLIKMCLSRCIKYIIKLAGQGANRLGRQRTGWSDTGF